MEHDLIKVSKQMFAWFDCLQEIGQVGLQACLLASALIVDSLNVGSLLDILVYPIGIRNIRWRQELRLRGPSQDHCNSRQVASSKHIASYYVGPAEYDVAAVQELSTTERKLTFMALNTVLGTG
ncbi:MAG: hypothetical protein ABSE43_06695 [Steroidobacteraceae bacterium]|jgi:hypothetical protein